MSALRRLCAAPIGNAEPGQHGDTQSRHSPRQSLPQFSPQPSPRTRRGFRRLREAHSFSSLDKSRELCQRSPGSFIRQRSTRCSSAAGVRGCKLDRGCGSFSRMAATMFSLVSPANGRLPDTISYSTQPKLKMSLRTSGGLALNRFRSHIEERSHDCAALSEWGAGRGQSCHTQPWWTGSL